MACRRAVVFCLALVTPLAGKTLPFRRTFDRRLTWLLLGLFLVAWGRPAAAIPPPFVSDEELAACPVIVVAKWEKEPLTPHHLIEDHTIKELEVRTQIVVTRVIRGALRPGKHTILLGPFIGWAERGGEVISYTSTEMIGDVKDVTDENLWFLKSRPSWDKRDKTVYLALDTYRGVQPKSLAVYFEALGGLFRGHHT